MGLGCGFIGWPSLGIAASAAFVDPGESTVVLRNERLEAGFVGPREGAEVELAWLRDLASGRRIELRSGQRDGLVDRGGHQLRSGSLAVLMRNRERPFAVDDPRCVGWIDTAAALGTDGNAAGWTTRVQRAELAGGGQALVVEQGADALEFGGERFALRSRIEWRLASGSGLLEARFGVAIPGMGRTAQAHGRSFYVSAVRFPRLFVRNLVADRVPDAGSETLVLPNQMGFLLRDSLRPGMRIPSFFSGPDERREWQVRCATVPLIACYDEVAHDVLYLSDDELDEWWRDYEVERHDVGADPFLELRGRHLPADLYAADGFEARYQVRIGLISGDWVDVADFHRGLLAAASPRHATPYGARRDTSPSLRAAPFEVRLAASRAADNQEELLLDVRDLRRAGGGAPLVIWNGGYWPDAFDDFFHRGQLPGRSTFVPAVHAAEEGGRSVVAPYVNTFFAVDGSSPGAGTTPQTEITARQALRRERGGFHRVAPDRSRFSDFGMCQAEELREMSPWGRLLTSTVVDILRATRARSVYLDMFYCAPCFGGPPEHHHAPGGGDYMHQGRLRQLRQIRDEAARLGLPFEGFACEGVHLGFVGEIDVMHTAPLHASFRARREPEEASAAAADAELRAIPFFRMVADGVRIGQIEQPSADLSAGESAWELATEVLAFGLLPHRLNENVDVLRTFGDPYQRLYEGGAECDGYFAHLVELMGDPDDGFLRFHEGTLRRCPTVRVGGVRRFAARPDSRRRIAPLQQEALVVALFAAPSRSGLREACVIATNPWVDGSEPELTLESLVIEPASWGIDGSRRYVVEEIDDHGVAVRRFELGPGESFRLDAAGRSFAPGEFRQWRLRG